MRRRIYNKESHSDLQRSKFLIAFCKIWDIKLSTMLIDSIENLYRNAVALNLKLTRFKLIRYNCRLFGYNYIKNLKMYNTEKQLLHYCFLLYILTSWTVNIWQITLSIIGPLKRGTYFDFRYLKQTLLILISIFWFLLKLKVWNLAKPKILKTLEWLFGQIILARDLSLSSILV